MATLTTNQIPTKRQRTTNKSTLEALQQERAPPPVEIGILVLPAGIGSTCKALVHDFIDDAVAMSENAPVTVNAVATSDDDTAMKSVLNAPALLEIIMSFIAM